MDLLRQLCAPFVTAYRFFNSSNHHVEVRECVSGRWVTLAKYAAVPHLRTLNAGTEATHALMDMSLHFEGRTELHVDAFELASIRQVRATLPSMRERATIPTKRAYLVVGPRGTKKTRLLCAVASNFAKRVCWVDGTTPLYALAALDPKRDLVAMRTHHFDSMHSRCITDVLRTVTHLYWREPMLVLILHDGDIDDTPSGIDSHVDYVLCTPQYAGSAQHDEVYTRMLGGTDEIDRDRFMDIMGNHQCALSLIERWILIRAPDVMLRMQKLCNTLHTFRGNRPLHCLRHHERTNQQQFASTSSTVSPESSV